MNNNLAQKSIQFALKGDWKEAIKVNKEILADDPLDTETLNRLAKAYFENGNSQKARTLCQKIIKIDPINSIAIKNLARWKSLKDKNPSLIKPSNTASFIEESGKTKLVWLLNLGDSKVTSNLDTCDEVKLAAHAHRVSITTLDGKYIGRLSDDLALRLRLLISLGNEYQAFIKSVDQKTIKVFIKETKKSKKSVNTSSFLIEKTVSEEEIQGA